MIFELKFECFGFEEKLGFFISQILQNEGVDFAIFKNQDLSVWIECASLPTKRLEEITQKLSALIPQSLYLKEVTTEFLENEKLPQKKEKFHFQESFSYCLECLKTDEGNECKVCKKKILTTQKSIFEAIYKHLLEKKSVKVVSESGEHYFSLTPSSRIYCLNLEKILEVCNATPKELQALLSYEKPILKVKANADFGLETQDVWISFAHDLELLKLFEYLKSQGIDFLFASQSQEEEFVLAQKIGMPKEMLVLENDCAVLLKSLEVPFTLKETFLAHKSKDKAFLSTILEENHLQEKNILNFYFSMQGGDKVCLYNSQTQWFNEVMSFSLPKDLATLFDLIANGNETGATLVENYKKAYPSLVEKNFSFEGLPQGIYGIWEIVRLVLGMQKNPLFLARENLCNKGVAIDYKFEEDSLIAQKFDVLSCIRSGMSFKLAGVEEGIIALGYIESFSLLPSKLYLKIRQLVDIDGLSLCGDLFQSKMLGDFFYKNNRQTPIYRNLAFPLLGL